MRNAFLLLAWEFAERVKGAVRLGLVLSLIVPAAGCDMGVFGPSTPRARFDLQGIITSASDGLPVEDAKVFLDYALCGGFFCLVTSPLPRKDTVVTDSWGRYHLDTRYYCPARLSVVAIGFAPHIGGRMECAETVERGALNATIAPLRFVTTVSVTPATSTVFVGTTTQLSAATLDDRDNAFSGGEVTWSSSDTAIAGVSRTGLVTGIAVGGPVTVTAESEGKTGTAQVTVALPQLSPGTVHGRVLWNEEPVGGATVLATESGYSSIHYGSALTDAQGDFSIASVPDGKKYLVVFGNQDEFWVATNTPFTMIPGTGTRAADTYLCKGFVPLAPQDGESMTTTHPVLRWDPYPSAVDYAARVIRDGDNSFIFSRGDHDARFEETTVQVDVDLSPGQYRWRVDAFNAEGHMIGCSYYPRSFTVTR